MTRNKGFQIGGYWNKMHFEDDGGGCLKWHIHGDGQFPSDNESDWIEFHICDFTQIEEFVKFWGKELRKKGLIK